MIVLLLIYLLNMISFAQMQSKTVEVNLYSEYLLTKPGSAIWLGVEINPNDGWHTYWTNPGDAGLATSVDFELPEGFNILDTIWQAPEIIGSDSIVSYGFHKKHYIFYLLQTPENISENHSEIKLKVKWLACKEKCIPGSEELTFNVNFSNVPIRDLEFEDIFKNIPQKLPETFNAFLEENSINLIIPEKYKFSKNARFIPYIEGIIDNLAEQVVNEQTIVAPLDRFHIKIPDILKALIIDDKKTYEINVKLTI